VLYLQEVEAACGLPHRSNTRPETRWATLPVQGVPPRGLQKKAREQIGTPPYPAGTSRSCLPVSLAMES